ncbi:Lcl domain-containing protein [Flavivirga jejuensis]|uniref:DUF1566 domain-containing protein n=1 Tax=Flavivirga jejuensis TaxID=870487 RepID=A0ABT8WP84_9FLAO|nr:DUF1566 domain-containing protein [Flavivirga jejuensis]MDO5974988.1 DUF1566 domain-containing protein [Flavivirga jejuensis]
MKLHLTLLLIILSFQSFSQKGSEDLSATIIGSGSPKYNPERSGPSVLISYKNTEILVDMGNGTQANLNKEKIKTKQLDGLLFTHHHLDHNEEFTPIFIHCLLGGNPFVVAGPNPTSSFVSNTLDLYKEDIEYRMKKSGRTLQDVKTNYSTKNLIGGETFTIGDIKVSCTKVNHSIYTLAYRFDAGGKSIVISGDLVYSESLPILAKNADYLIIDSGGAIGLGSQKKQNENKNKNRKNTHKKERAHTNLDESSRMAKEAHVKNLVLTHFVHTDIDEKATTDKLRINFTGTVIYAEDLMTIPLKKVSFTEENLNYTYPIVDTGIKDYYSNTDHISKPSVGETFYGQDANYNGNAPSYTDNGDGTITDHVTGLMWEKDMGSKMTFEEAFQKAKKSNLGGYSDWRVPSVKELYSIILFTGKVKGATAIDMFIDTDYFTQPLGNTDIGEREIDVQTWSSTEYVGQTMNRNETVFGVNFVDGRIKGYPKYNPRTRNENKMYFRMVRGNVDYGKNNFIDNGDGTVSDLATGLMWQKSDDGNSRDWEASLAYAENLELATYSDWRLPNAKELQSIVDYSRSPQTTNSPAINSIFETTEINDPEGNAGQYPFFWSSTTHLDGVNPYASAVYVAFGEGQGKMHGRLMDVHGAGCQRSDHKSGNINNYPQFFGPQGDVRYVYNFVRAVRTINAPVKVDTIQQSNQQSNQQTEQKPNQNPNLNGPPSFANMLKKMDVNNDGKISKSEAKGKLKENFERRDVNKDGYITDNEMTKRRRR